MTSHDNAREYGFLNSDNMVAIIYGFSSLSFRSLHILLH